MTENNKERPKTQGKGMHLPPLDYQLKIERDSNS
jgi:hypothetical protein